MSLALIVYLIFWLQAYEKKTYVAANNTVLHKKICDYQYKVEKAATDFLESNLTDDL